MYKKSKNENTKNPTKMNESKGNTNENYTEMKIEILGKG